MADDLPDAPWATPAQSAPADLPDAPWATPSTNGAEHPSLWGAVKDIPHETYNQFAGGLDKMRAAFVPWSPENRAILEAGSKDSLLDPSSQLAGGKLLASGVGGAMQAASAPFTGPATSIGGYGLDLANRGLRAGAVALYGEDKERQTEAALGHTPGGPTYEENKREFEGMLPAIAPGRGGVRAPSVGPAPKPPGDMLDVMLSEGQRTGDLPTIRREQAALRGQLGSGAEEQAKAFGTQQAGQVQSAAERIAQGFDPFGQTIAQTPQEASGLVSTSLQDAATHGRDLAATNAEALSAGIDNLPHPLDAADTVANSLRDVAHYGRTAADLRGQRLLAEREAIRDSLNPSGGVVARSPQEAADIISGAVGNQAENAAAARDAAYTQLRELPGQFHPATFNRIGQAIRADLNSGTQPIRVNPQTTPIANHALTDLDEILGQIQQQRVEGRVQPRPPVTAALVDDTRKRLGAFMGDAMSAARSSNNFSDVRAMRGVMNGFDDYVADRLRAGTFMGDAAPVLDAMQNARRLHADYRRTFTPQGPGDTVGSAVQNIVGRYEGQAAPPGQIATWLYGAGAMPPKIARRMLGIFGEQGPEASALRQGYLSHIIERPEGVTQWGPEQVADRIYTALNGPGRSLTETYFPPELRNRLRTYADGLRQSVEPQAAPTDVVSRAIGRIVGEGGQPATSGEVADTLFGRSVVGSNPTGVKIAQHIRDTQGPESPAFAALRQGVMSRLTNAAAGRAGFDPVTIAQNIRGFLDGGKRMAEVLFTPEERAALDQYAGRLEQHAAATAAPKDEVGRALDRIAGRNGEPPATLSEVSDLLFGRSGAGDRGVSVRLAQRLKAELGESSPQWSAVKQGMFSKLIEPAEGKLDWGAQKISDRLHEFLNGSGKPLAEALYAPAERDLVRQFADLQRKLVVPKTGANWSETSTFLAPILRKIGSRLGMALGAGAGHLIAPGLPWGVSEAAGAGVAKGIGAIGNALDARRIVKQMPLIDQAMRAYQKALAAHAATSPTLSNKTLTLAATNLANTLAPLGIDFRKLNAIQGPTPAGADQDQRQRGGRLDAQPDQGEGDKPGYAAGGATVRKKLSHKAVGYISQSRVPGRHCSLCSMFQAGHCTLVRDPINPAGLCRRFEARNHGLGRSHE